jgi:hypothetical protein
MRRTRFGSEELNFGGLTFRRTVRPVFLAAEGPKATGEPFDLMEFAGDMLPPTTVITHVGRAKDGGLVVRGTTADDGRVRAVLVNGRQATATAANFAEWEATLPWPAAGELTVRARAVDQAGNVEPRPHRRRVRVPADAAQEVAFIPLPDEAKPTPPQSAQAPAKTAGRATDLKALRGAWEVVEQRRAGRLTERPRNMRWVIAGDTIAMQMGAGPKKVAPGKPGGKFAAMPVKALGPNKILSPVSGRLDAAASRVDLTVLKRAVYGIYKLEGDELTLCLGPTQPSSVYDKEAKADANSRPTAISPEAGTLIVLRRVQE